MRASLALAALATTVAAIDASVWTFDTVSRGPKITPENARLVLAHRLGLSRYHKIGNADEHTLELLNGIHPPLFAAQSASRKLMLVVEGLDDGSFGIVPSFTIANPPSSSANEQLVEDLLLQDMHKRDAARCDESSSRGLIQGGFSANNPAGLCTVRSRDTFAKLSSLQQLEVLNGDAESMINLVYGVALPPSITTDYTAIFHVKSLDDTAQKYGTKSTQYSKIRSALLDIISNTRRSDRFSQFIVVGIPSQSHFAKRDSYGFYEMPLHPRREEPLRETTAPKAAALPQEMPITNRTIPKTTTPVCWSSENACKINTADCSRHGSCTKKYSEKVSDDETGAECWACACQPSYVDQAEGRKTIFWGGPACQKKDISMPFFLFAGFTIAALAALSYGIGLLYSIGQEDLPSVLGAGVAPPSKK